MESSRFSKKILNNAFHLPTVMLAVGYGVYWIELYFLKGAGGQTSPLAWLLFVLVSVFVFKKQWTVFCSSIKEAKAGFANLSAGAKTVVAVAGGIILAMLACSLYASFFPPHLVQESDILSYHLTLPKQHLLRGSFAHIPWSMTDLYLLPIDFALAPYWLSTDLPNKFPQFLFLLGFLGIAGRLVYRFSRKNAACAGFVVMAILGSHNVGIQLGTAMLDLAVCYLLLAAFDSFLKGSVVLAAIEFTFYFWSKSFVPVQFTCLVIFLLLLYIFAKKIGFHKVSWVNGYILEEEAKRRYKSQLKKGAVYFVCASILVGGPFVMKSLYYSGTPVYPIVPGIVQINKNIDQNSAQWQSIVRKSEEVVAIARSYGSGRSVQDLIKHFWLIAVPEKGVNNRYDYPVGLAYLLFLLPFACSVSQSLRQKEFCIMPMFVVTYWASWWFGSQQSRFLLVPIIGMFIIVASQVKYQSKVFVAAVLIALSLVSLSVVRAHKHDFGKTRYDVLRQKDKDLVAMSKAYQGERIVQLDFFDAAFADFVIDVANMDSVYVLDH